MSKSEVDVSLTEYRPITYAERASFYETEYSSTTDFVFILSLITSAVNSILELPSGSGRLTVELAKTRRQIIAVDREPQMLNSLCERLKLKGLDQQVMVICSDIRYFAIASCFDLILIPQGGLQLLPNDMDMVRTLSSLSRMLSSRGHVMLDIGVFNAGYKGDPTTKPSYYDPMLPDYTITKDWQKPLPNDGMLKRSHFQQHTPNFILTTFLYDIEIPNGQSDKCRYTMKTRRFSFKTLKRLVSQSGLKISQAYKDYSRTPLLPFDVASTSRMILLLQKANSDGLSHNWR